ncbi:hypothetical protein [Winogradskyella helgolandensis]|uniref:hypothetical protein n=1 Tax=Winogradskyella helgolandensis TaxID=2697010 RepID=UPI0015C0BD8C|nr:hypothetical protein [Winogradskyella helgolandensis]
MFKKILFTVSFVIISFYGNSQKNINDYKYIIIPDAFEFSKSDDQYQLNSLLEFLFNKYGYEAYFIKELSNDLKKDPCLALTADVSNDEGGMFKTKLEIILKDCYDVEVFRSKIGESRIKEFDKAYNEALRDAFETFQNMDYNYVGKEVVAAQPKEEQPQTEKQPVKEIVKIEEVAVIKESKEEPKEKVTALPVKASDDIKSELFYAQAISNGFQLVNSEPKVVMILLNSSAKDIYIVKDKNAIVFKKEGQWMYSENNGVSTVEKILNIKF